jgi:hypothetical protein
LGDGEFAATRLVIGELVEMTADVVAGEVCG